MAYVDDKVLSGGGYFRIRASDGTLVNATVRPLPFYDPGGARQTPGMAGAGG